MARRPALAYTHSKSFFYKLWLIGCFLLLVATAASSFLVYINVANQLRKHMAQRLLWQTNFCHQQLKELFLRAALKLDSLVQSSAALSQDLSLLRQEMDTIRNNFPSIIRIWVAYRDGRLITSSITRPDYIRQLPWWRDYLNGKIPESSMGYLIESSRSRIGRLFIEESGLTTLAILISVSLDGAAIVRAAGAQIDLHSALTESLGVDFNWVNIPVSIYSEEGVLVVSPYHYFRGNLKNLLNKPSDHPLIRTMLLKPYEEQGFDIYTHMGRKLAGAYLRIPSLGLVLVVEYPAGEVVGSVHRVALGPLFTFVLLLVIATILVTNIYTHNKRLRQLEQLARSAELRALQAQINPHFLFNTFDCLAGLAVETGNVLLVRILRSLSRIFRYTTRKNEEWVTLAEELDYLKEYISIQEARYNSRFTFDLSVPDSLLPLRIPKFCLQPIVENCFVHGVDKSLDPVDIKVIVTRIGEEIDICVSDNGPGIEPARLEEINRNLISETYALGNQGHGVGLANIHQRLRYAYGPPYGLRIVPLKQGVAVHLSIPFKIENDSVATGLGNPKPG
ncbi:MAG: sensor histidine kinase [Firmicutes bacterium]|nr:sensor histidine kinase [Bacillota bacterium]